MRLGLIDMIYSFVLWRKAASLEAVLASIFLPDMVHRRIESETKLFILARMASYERTSYGNLREFSPALENLESLHI